MVVSADQRLWELFHHLCAKVCLCGVVPASVNIHIGDVAIMAISSCPYFEATLDGLFRHVLLQCRSAFELYHSLIDAVLTMRIVAGQERLTNHLDYWTNFTQPVVSWFASRRDGCIVGKVEEAWQFEKPLPGDTWGNGKIMKKLTCGPVVISVG